MARPKKYTHQVSTRIAESHKRVLGSIRAKMQRRWRRRFNDGEVIRWILEQPQVAALEPPAEDDA